MLVLCEPHESLDVALKTQRRQSVHHAQVPKDASTTGQVPHAMFATSAPPLANDSGHITTQVTPAAREMLKPCPNRVDSSCLQI